MATPLFSRRDWRARAGAVLLLGGLSACSFLDQNEPAGATSGPEPGQYYTVADFAQWRIDGREYDLRDVHSSGAAERLTHLEYSFGSVTRGGECEIDPERDYQRLFDADRAVDGIADRSDQPLAGNFHQIRQLKTQHPELTVMYSIGGWGESRYFSNAARTPQARERFVESCLDLVIRGNLPRAGAQGGLGAASEVFDGIDIDWEWPGAQGADGNIVREEDRRNLTLLLEEFRRQLDAYGDEVDERYSLSLFVPPDVAKIDAGYEPDEIFRYVDYATVSGFDFSGPWDQRTGHHAQLSAPSGDPADSELSVETAISNWLERDAPSSKLLVGVPAFGRGWQGVPPTNDGLHQPAEGAAPGRYEDGAEDYRILADRPGQRFRDRDRGAVWSYDGDEWWSYDDSEVMTQKASYVREQRLGGMTMWSLDADDGEATLLKSIDDGLNEP